MAERRLSGLERALARAPSADGAAAVDDEPRSILVTGGAGFIGSHVAVRLVTQYPQYKV